MVQPSEIVHDLFAPIFYDEKSCGNLAYVAEVFMADPPARDVVDLFAMWDSDA